MLASVITTRAGRQLSDAGATRWTFPVLLDYLNEARRKVMRAHPDRFPGVRTVKLTEGAKQKRPSDCILITEMRNMGADGASPGGMVRGPVDRKATDILSPAWMNQSGYPVREYMQDSLDSDDYYVNPPPPDAETMPVYVDLYGVFVPADVTDKANELYIPDDLEDALLAWVMFRSFSEETEEGSMDKAGEWLALYKAGVGNAA